MFVIKKSLVAKIFKVEGIVLYPFVLFASQNPSTTLMNHEMIHVMQIKKHGLMTFYFSYLKQYIKFRIKGLNHQNSYHSISFEIEAYKNQKQDPIA